MGRALHAKAGWFASRVEYTKRAGSRDLAVIHAGADLLVRTAYAPEVWPHRISVHDATGLLKTADVGPWDIVGPLCFSGDRVAEQRQLPAIVPGDIVVVHDVGAYTLSMWSRYNSRQAPAVYSVEGDGPVDVTLMKPAETVDEVLRFWGCP